MGRDIDQVTTNRENLSLKYPIDSSAIVSMNQIHSNIVCSVDCTKVIESCDALITNKTYTPLMVLVADCIPIFPIEQTKIVVGLQVLL